MGAHGGGQGADAANEEQTAALAAGRILCKDAIADITLQQVLTRPAEFDVIATTNLNGDYLSDALAAQVGGIGIAPGGNINYDTGHAVFEATHGTAPKYAGRDMVNPGSLVLSAEMMLRYMGWKEAADLIISAMDGAIAEKNVTYDFARLMDGANRVSCSEFGRHHDPDDVSAAAEYGRLGISSRADLRKRRRALFALRHLGQQRIEPTEHVVALTERDVESHLRRSRRAGAEYGPRCKQHVAPGRRLGQRDGVRDPGHVPSMQTTRDRRPPRVAGRWLPDHATPRPVSCGEWRAVSRDVFGSARG